MGAAKTWTKVPLSRNKVTRTWKTRHVVSMLVGWGSNVSMRRCAELRAVRLVAALVGAGWGNLKELDLRGTVSCNYDDDRV